MNKEKDMINILNIGKDKALSKAILVILNKKLKKFGTISELKLDTKNKKIALKIGLKGELEPLLVTIHRYEIKEIDKKYYLIAHDIETSREWINLVAKEYFYNEKFEIPKKLVKITKALI